MDRVIQAHMHAYGESVNVSTLAKKLYGLNVSGIRARYGDREARQCAKDCRAYVFAPQRESISIESMLKSVECLCYQCHEGTVPRRKAYLALEALVSSLATEIVHESKKWQDAPWG